MIGQRDRPPRLAALALGAVAMFCACRFPVGPPKRALLPPSAGLLMFRLARANEAIHSLRGFASIGYRITRDRRLLSGRHAVVVERPDRFRLEAYSPFGLLAVVACDGRELSVYDRKNSAVYRGPASAELIGSYISVPLSPRDIVSVLLGRLPLKEFDEEDPVEFDPDRGQFRLYHAADGGGAQSVWFEPGRLRVREADIVEVGGRRLRISLDDYGLVGGVPLAHRIEVESEPGGGGLRIAYRSPTVNVDIPVDLFRIPVREGVREIMIDGRSGRAEGGPDHG